MYVIFLLLRTPLIFLSKQSLLASNCGFFFLFCFFFFFWSEKPFISLSVLKCNFTGYRFLANDVFFLSTFLMFHLTVFACLVSEKADGILMFDALQASVFFLFVCFVVFLRLANFYIIFYFLQFECDMPRGVCVCVCMCIYIFIYIYTHRHTLTFILPSVL